MIFLKRIIDDYHVTMFLGVMFIVSGLMAGATEVVEVYTGFKVDLFHSMIFLGVFNCCMATVFIIIGSRNIEAAEAEARKRRQTASDTVVTQGSLAAFEARLADLERWRKDRA